MRPVPRIPPLQGDLMTETSQDKQKSRKERLGLGPVVRHAYNPKYSNLIRRLRMILPLVALSIAAAVFAWSYTENLKIITREEIAPAARTIGKNELLNPRFESRDKKDQPFTITAKRALQGESNDDLVILESPVADMMLTSGNWIAIEALQGAYRQDNQRLLLSGAVKLFHDKGYYMNMEKLHVDIKKQTAWSDVDVYGQGPEGTLEAKGMNGDAESDILVFKGPARLVLNMKGETQGLAGIAP